MPSEYYARLINNDRRYRVELIPIERPFSNFDFIEHHFIDCYPLRRIFSQIRQHSAKTLSVEIIKIPGEFKEENEDLKKRDPNHQYIKAYRLGFFSEDLTSINDLENISPSSFLGYAIVKVDQIPRISQMMFSRVYESVVSQSQHINNYIKGARKWHCIIGGIPLEIDGYMFAQQNGLTNVCAHATLRTVTSCFDESGGLSYRQMNNIIGIDHINITAENGMEVRNGMLRILDVAGINYRVAEYSDSEGISQDVPFQKFIYGSIESGYPALLGFKVSRSNSGHIIPLFGHTFNEDTWVPKADISYFEMGASTRYIPSESWVSMYIAHDDNWGSNLCIPRRYLHTPKICTVVPNQRQLCNNEPECVVCAISTFPKRVKTDPIAAEAIGADYLFSIIRTIRPNRSRNTWINRLIKYYDQNELILRPILIEKDSYTNHLSNVNDWERSSIDTSFLSAIRSFFKSNKDYYYWMVELSVPELFPANRRKLGEVILRAEIQPPTKRTFNSFVIARLLDRFFIHTGNTTEHGNPEFITPKSGVKSHVELYGCEDA